MLRFSISTARCSGVLPPCISVAFTSAPFLTSRSRQAGLFAFTARCTGRRPGAGREAQHPASHAGPVPTRAPRPPAPLTVEVGQAQQVGGSRTQVGQQRPHHLFVARVERQVQQGVAVAVQQGGVSTGLQQELHHLGLLGDDGQVQRRLRTGAAVTSTGPVPAPLTHSPGSPQHLAAGTSPG